MYTSIASSYSTTTDTEQERAQQIADTYLVQTLGRQYSATHAVYTGVIWRFLIRYHPSNGAKAVIVGRLDVNPQTEKALSLSDDEIQLIRERAIVQTADLSGKPPLDLNGYVPSYLAKRNVKGYLGEHVSIFADPVDNPQWIVGVPPHWRVAVTIRHQNSTTPLSVGSVDVNACTGEVIPPTPIQLTAMKSRTRGRVSTS